MVKKLTTSFVKVTYCAFFNLEGTSLFFHILKASGVIEDMIDDHPVMKLSKDRYLEAVDTIISFPEAQKLLS